MRANGEGMRGARVLRAVAWGLLAVLGAVVLLELGVRLLRIAPPPPKMYRDTVYVPDPYLPYRSAPGIQRDVPAPSGEFRQVFTHNSVGFRDVEHSIDKPVGTVRVLGLGGSITYGAGVRFEESYLYLLEEMLNRHFRQQPVVEVIKAGVGGFFPEAERLLLEHYGLQYRPDLVIVAFDATDLSETYLGCNEFKVYDGFLKTSEARELGYFRTFCSVHTHIGRMLYRGWSQRRRARLLRHFDEQREAVWLEVEQELRRMKDLMGGDGRRVAICSVPLSLPPDAADAARLAEACRRNELVLIDTGPALERAARGGPVYWKKDGHCNASGHRAIAGAILERVTAEGLIR